MSAPARFAAAICDQKKRPPRRGMSLSGAPFMLCQLKPGNATGRKSSPRSRHHAMSGCQTSAACLAAASGVR
jgi:hypothetical protein